MQRALTRSNRFRIPQPARQVTVELMIQVAVALEPRLLLAVEATEGQVAAAMVEAEANHGDAPVLGMRASKVVVCNTKTVLG